LSWIIIEGNGSYNGVEIYHLRGSNGTGEGHGGERHPVIRWI
jgi:hypothetical protein